MSEHNNNFDEKSPYDFEPAPRGAGRLQAFGLVAAGLVIAGGLVSGGAWAVTHTVDTTGDQQITDVSSNDPLPGGFNDDLGDDSTDVSTVGALGPDLNGLAFAGDDSDDQGDDNSDDQGADSATEAPHHSTPTADPNKPVPPISFGNSDDDDSDDDQADDSHEDHHGDDEADEPEQEDESDD